MIRAAACRVNETSSYTRDEEGVIDLELNDMVQVLLPCRQHVVQFLCLRDGPREAVEDEAVS